MLFEISEMAMGTQMVNPKNLVKIEEEKYSKFVNETKELYKIYAEVENNIMNGKEVKQIYDVFISRLNKGNLKK